ncbi:hypothetical protein MUP77_25260, partial [Candidatus Bathyarchaeota archaeon]|nr:hypothetical protein [Candidatus Bathyarchaeota archaeon]
DCRKAICSGQDGPSAVAGYSSIRSALVEHYVTKARRTLAEGICGGTARMKPARLIILAPSHFETVRKTQD